MLILNENDQRELLEMNEVIERTEDALVQYSQGNTITPIRASLPFNEGENSFLVMPSVVNASKNVGLKIVSVAPNNPGLGKKTINGVVMLSDYQTGEPIALLEGSYLTKIRTGALSGVATKYLSRKKSRKFCIIGTGAQAAGLFDAIKAVRPIEEVFLYNRTRENAETFAEYLQEHNDLQVSLFDNPNDAMENADIIVTATNSLEPVFSAPLKEGTHINAVGSFKPAMQELPFDAITNADKVVVESKPTALEETGDLIHPIQAGVFSDEAIHGELGNIVSGKLPGREHEHEVTLFKSVGLAVVDIVIANYFYEKAVNKNKGKRFHL
ncbi:ornithine cyclodeaminase family protein [Oceanobacillus jeddahense]|uniref:ornithine cyclodeaminase family protein n=1 Tax=Oceanobacillus jeddahense TaxID=1462527 RepID=UPI00059633C6|nr:ornithine cyclodeaminase family protein [Oceanobacillus jeddahense]